MPFKPQKGVYYRMPVFFGPTPGPRQFRGIEQYDYATEAHMRVIGARFLTDRDMLQAWLPSGFAVWGEPVATCEVTYIDRLAWLAGRGYNWCDFKFNVVFDGKHGPTHGTFLVVRFEDLPDPILSGREELGHNKLWCAIPPIREVSGKCATEMSWLGTTFWKIAAWDLRDESVVPKHDPKNSGVLSYKYMPRTGEWGTPDIAYTTLTPTSTAGKLLRYQVGNGSVEFPKISWEELPTLHHLAEAFAALPQIESRGGYVMEIQGGASGVATRIVE